MVVARGAWTLALDPWAGVHGSRFAVRFSWQGPRDIGSICAVLAADSADFSPRPALAGTGACAMFLTNNHKENSMSNIKSHRVPR